MLMISAPPPPALQRSGLSWLLLADVKSGFRTELPASVVEFSVEVRGS